MERVLAGLNDPTTASDPRLLTSSTDSEDAAVLSFPGGQALVQTVDFFTPIVNDPFLFGRIAAANALSDVYAMGGTPLCAMNIVCYPMKAMGDAVLSRILAGGMATIREAGAALAGGHSVEDDEIKYGLAVTGTVDPQRFATNAGARSGDVLLLTKPLGMGVYATAVKARWDGDAYAAELEAELAHWAARLNRAGGEVIAELGLRAATDVTGFGLGGHLLEMARASRVCMQVHAAEVPLLRRAYELASMGLVPVGSHENRKHYCEHHVQVASGVDPLLMDLCFDAQTSGGLILCVDAALADEARRMLDARGETAHVIGRVTEREAGGPMLRLV